MPNKKRNDKKPSRRDVPDALRVKPDSKFKLRDADATRDFGWDKDKCVVATADNRNKLEQLQFQLYADGRFSMLVVIQAIDGGGKDSTIRRVFTAFNPQGCTVTAFKAPSSEVLQHDFLWRVHKAAPARGSIAVFNRSHYEDVLIVRVNDLVPRAVWERRYDQINEFERILAECDTRIVKLFLHISKEEQRERFQDRLDDRKKNWKFDLGDLEKRTQWDAYNEAFEIMLEKCSTAHAPWYVIPANRKWFRDFAVSQILRYELEQLPLKFPQTRLDVGSIKLV
ncbi:MAG: polyphosphate kinase 2 family protein [Pseudomonadales bacterium]|nr:polyphosphate kinase 2 family protein [Pseudomonadales bacterium]